MMSDPDHDLDGLPAQATAPRPADRKQAFRDFRRLGTRRRAGVLFKARKGEPSEDPEATQVAVAWAREVLRQPPRSWAVEAGIGCGLLVVGEWLNDAFWIVLALFFAAVAASNFRLPAVAGGVIGANDPSTPAAGPVPPRAEVSGLRPAMWRRAFRARSAVLLTLLVGGSLTMVESWPWGLPVFVVALLLWFQHAARVRAALVTELHGVDSGEAAPPVVQLFRRNRTDLRRSVGLASVVALATAAGLLGGLQLATAVGERRAAAVDAEIGWPPSDVYGFSPGTCFDGTVLAGPVNPVSCEGGHSGQYFGEVRFPAGPYPGDSEVDAQLRLQCEVLFRDFTGQELGTATGFEVEHTSLWAQAWERGRRIGRCSLVSAIGDKLVGDAAA